MVRAGCCGTPPPAQAGEHIGGLDIRYFLEHRDEFRQVEKAGESRARTVARALGRKFNARHRFTEGGSPCVEVLQSRARSVSYCR